MILATQADWEAMWAPYDGPTYQEALSLIPFGATVLDIGSGDLRFARMAAGRAALIYAIERRPELAASALASELPSNIKVICGDASTISFPAHVDTAVLLMRHCAEFDHYRRKLEAVGCRYLITNARWGMGVERIDLDRSALPFMALASGWYACRCGATGFREGPTAKLTLQEIASVTEVATCPTCDKLAGE